VASLSALIGAPDPADPQAQARAAMLAKLARDVAATAQPTGPAAALNPAWLKFAQLPSGPASAAIGRETTAAVPGSSRQSPPDAPPAADAFDPARDMTRENFDHTVTWSGKTRDLVADTLRARGLTVPAAWQGRLTMTPSELQQLQQDAPPGKASRVVLQPQPPSVMPAEPVGAGPHADTGPSQSARRDRSARRVRALSGRHADHR
jgi:hypothetical protein